MADRLERYREMRDFTITPEPRGHRAAPKKAKRLRYYLQRHAATRLHYDLRLDPADKRLAMQTEDHPLEYGEFEGLIPRSSMALARCCFATRACAWVLTRTRPA
jgi:bifunctional non-homologous end joining protein LigD